MRKIRPPLLVMLLTALCTTYLALLFACAQQTQFGPTGFPGKHGRFARGRLPVPPKVKQDRFSKEIADRNWISPFGVDDPFLKKGNPFDWNGEEGAKLIVDTGVAWIMPAATFGITQTGMKDTGADSEGGSDEEAPEPSFLRHDAYVRYAQALNLHILFIIGPRQISMPPPPAAARFPDDMKAYRKMVLSTVERYDGDGHDDMPGLRYPIKYWMILNEPFFKRYWDGTAEEACRLFIESYNAVKEVDPDARVVLPSLLHPHRKETFAFADEFLEHYQEALKKGKAPRTIDAMDLHWINRKKEADDVYDEYQKGLKRLTDKSEEIGLKISEIVCTEACILTSERDIVPRDVVKRYLLARTLGIQKIFWSSLVSADPERNMFTRISLKTRPDDPALNAFRFMVKMVGSGKCSLVRADGKSFEIKVEEGPTVLWSATSKEIRFDAQGRETYDIFGKPLSDAKLSIGRSPVYVSP